MDGEGATLAAKGFPHSFRATMRNPLDICSRIGYGTQSMKRPGPFFLFLLPSLLLSGCLMAPKPVDPNTVPGVAMGDKAPDFTGDLPKFVVGRWSPSMGEMIDPAFAKQLGMDSVNQQNAEADLDRWWNFKADGTFTYRTRAFSWQVEGTWKASQDAVDLTYSTMDGKPLAQAEQESKAKEETGRQAAIINEMGKEFVFKKLPSLSHIIVGDDKKHLYFVTGSGAPDPAMGSMGGESRMGLSRIEDAK